MARMVAGTRPMTLGWLFVIAILGGGVAHADEPTEVSAIMADPDAYHLRAVTIPGIVGHVRVLEPYFLPSGTACYGAYTFTLEDLNGSGDVLEVAVLGVCGRPVILFPDVADGDQVMVRAEIQLPGRVGESRSLDGRPLPKRDQPAVQAIAKSITRLGE